MYAYLTLLLNPSLRRLYVKKLKIDSFLLISPCVPRDASERNQKCEDTRTRLMDRVFHVPVRLGAQIHAWRWSRVCRIWTLCQSAFNFHPFDYHNPAPS